MACFTNFLTYKTSGITPTSGLYVNDLYGVNLSKANAIANTDHASGVAFINAKIAHAITLVSNELKRYVMPYFKLHSVVGHYLGGEFDDALAYHTGVAANRGLRFDISETVLSKIVVNRVRLLFNSAGDFNVVVKDGETTTNYPVTLVARTEQDIEINYTADRNRIYIYMNDAALKPAKGSANMSCCGEGYDVLNATGWDGASVSSNHYGIQANVTVICSTNNLACLLKDQLGPPVLYRFGIEMANEALETDRFNYFTLVTRDDIKELRESYIEDYKESMKDISRTIPVLLRKLDDHCIDCNQDRYIEQTP